MPLLIYSGAVLAWFLKVIEAIVAAPFVAVALIEPSQDDFGRAEASVLLALHVMLKPALILIGLLMGGRMVTIAISLFTLPLNAYMNYDGFTVTSSDFVIERLIIYILLNQVVIYMVVGLAGRAFSLIYKIPDQVFGWIGHRGHDSDVSSMVSEAKQGAEQGIQMMQQIFKIGSAVGKVSLDAMKTLTFESGERK
jgi:conjugal transfer/type IV secretion protein DotA/TraY